MDRCRVLVCLALCAVWHVGPTLGQSQIDMNVLARLENLEKQVSGQQYQLEVQNKLIADLQTRVTDQESAIAKQQATINEQQTTIVEQQKTISDQQNEIVKQRSSLSGQHRRLTRLEEIMMVAKTTNGIQTGPKKNTETGKNEQHKDVPDVSFYRHPVPAEVNKDQDKLQEHGNTNTTRPEHIGLNKRLVLESESPVAFHAVNTGAATSHVGIGQKIMYPTVMLNLGAGFHDQHGIFIAPAAGLYIFSTSILSYTNDHSEIHVSLVKNGVILARAYGHGYAAHDQGSVTIVTQLAIGDEVWVRETQVADATYWGDYFTSFMGCLLWPM